MSAAAGLLGPVALGQNPSPPGTPAPTAPAAPASPNEAIVESEPIPPQVLASAVEAVNKLGKEMELGRYAVAVERMNPQWKKRTADRMGGEKALKAQLDGVAAQMVQQGVNILSSKAEGKPIPYEVKPGGIVMDGNKVVANRVRHTMWLVLVPTTTRVRIFPQGATRAVIYDSYSFQVALADKDKLDWTFIDGASVNVADLRGMFSTLPKDMTLPTVRKQAAR